MAETITMPSSASLCSGSGYAQIAPCSGATAAGAVAAMAGRRRKSCWSVTE
ncbi:hypothetical protein ACOT81_04695 [Streptomyces sp. WI04-05B]|uniref:hypothetical protein n=1 Tax=Streptomyces TaxID=1883 RepID=UPI0029C0D429|nr:MULTISPECIES: hypothetical protein [unclassified Streptomyces]